MRLLFLASLGAACWLAGCASSSSHLLAPARPPIRPDQVKVYRVAPKNYQQIATLDATSGGRFFHGNERSDAEVIERLKEEAAKVGANGVLLSLVGDEPSGSIGLGLGGGGYASRSSGFNGEASGSAPLVQTAAHGLAIYVPSRR
jgi:hypothetical protein